MKRSKHRGHKEDKNGGMSREDGWWRLGLIRLEIQASVIHCCWISNPFSPVQLSENIVLKKSTKCFFSSENTQWQHLINFILLNKTWPFSPSNHSSDWNMKHPIARFPSLHHQMSRPSSRRRTWTVRPCSWEVAPTWTPSPWLQSQPSPPMYQIRGKRVSVHMAAFLNTRTAPIHVCHCCLTDPSQT